MSKGSLPAEDNLAPKSRTVAIFYLAALIGATFLALARAQAAELVMFEQAGCAWCVAFDREIAPIYAKTDEALRAPLRRVNIAQALPPDLAFVEVERLTPLFVLVDKGREIGRIRGYSGREMFWTQLYMLMQKLGAAETDAERAQGTEKTSRAAG
jgi:thioredoxin-related protein